MIIREVHSGLRAQTIGELATQDAADHATQARDGTHVQTNTGCRHLV